MSAELPPLENSTKTAPAPTEIRTPSPDAAQSLFAPARWSVGSFVAILGLGAILLYGAVGFLREAGIYDVRALWMEPPTSPGLAKMPAVSAAAAPVASHPVPAPVPEDRAVLLRDQPPRTPPQNLPQFTIRDGEHHDFLFSVDEETMKRLGEIQGQLDGLTQMINRLNQTVQTLARNATLSQRQNRAQQARLQQTIHAARQEIATLQVTAQEVEARLKRGQGYASVGRVGAVAPSGSPVAGWSVKAVSGDRAWLRTPRGGEVTVIAGERLKTLGAVQAVDAMRGIVVLADGRYLW